MTELTAREVINQVQKIAPRYTSEGSSNSTRPPVFVQNRNDIALVQWHMEDGGGYGSYGTCTPFVVWKTASGEIKWKKLDSETWAYRTPYHNPFGEPPECIKEGHITRDSLFVIYRYNETQLSLAELDGLQTA